MGGAEGLGEAVSEGKLPAWLHKRLRVGSASMGQALHETCLHTVCEKARCPNRGDCFRRNHATFLLLGPECTRSCAFCAVQWNERPKEPDHEEPARVATYCHEHGLNNVVLTMVTRDDLADGGARHVARTVEEVRCHVPAATVEVLVSDFGGQEEAVKIILDARPTVFAHNVETVRFLSPKVRFRATYEGSLAVLRNAKRLLPQQRTKSGLMVGLGESREQVFLTLEELARAKVDVVTIGQYLRPTRTQLHVAEWIDPDRFAEYKAFGESLGFAQVLCGPFVRSSSLAEASHALN